MNTISSSRTDLRKRKPTQTFSINDDDDENPQSQSPDQLSPTSPKSIYANKIRMIIEDHSNLDVTRAKLENDMIHFEDDINSNSNTGKSVNEFSKKHHQSNNKHGDVGDPLITV